MKKCGLLPNKMTKTFEHLPGDDLKRLRLCRWLRRRRRNFAERLISIDEATFTLDGTINIQCHR